MDPQPRQFLLAREIEDAERGPDHPAVERHAAVPQLQDVDRVLEIIGEIVEQDVADAAAEDDPQRGVKDQVVGMAAGHRRAGLLDQLQQVPIADENAGEVGEAVPAQVEGPMWSATGDRPRSGKAMNCELSAVCKDFPINVQRLIRWAAERQRSAEQSMPSELDRRYDDVLAEVIGPGGRLVIGHDEQGRAIVDNFPGHASRPCSGHSARSTPTNEAVVAGDERLTFADLDRISERLAHGLAGAGIGKGDRVGIAMRNCPAWIVAYMAIAKAGGGRDACSTAGGKRMRWSMRIELTEPKLIIADAPRAKRIAARCAGCDIVSLPVELPIEQAIADADPAPLSDAATARGRRRKTMPRSCSPPGSTGEAKGALSTHRAVTTATYTYATGLMVMLGLLTEEGRAPETRRAPCSACPCSTSPAKCR